MNESTSTRVVRKEARVFRETEEPQVILRNDDWAVLNKPAHLLIHPTRPTGEPTLLEWLRAQNWGATASFINRIDRETSGLVIAALNTVAASVLGKMTMRREIEKDYLAIVWGKPTTDHGIIDAPTGRIGINEENPIYLKQGVKTDGAAAQTEYWIEQSSGDYSLLRLSAHTGRLHQLRVHLSHIGCPIVGDKIYGPDANLYLKFIEHGWTAEHEEKLLLNRHALHAWKLRFNWQSKTIEAEAPLPSDMAQFAKAHINAANA